MSDYWETNDVVISTLDRSLDAKGDQELKKDYKRLNGVSMDYTFINEYVSFAILPAFLSLVTTIVIAMIKPEYIHYLFEEAGLNLNVSNNVLGGGLAIFNFVLTLVGLTNAVSFKINRSISGRPKRKIQRRHVENLSMNADRHGTFNWYSLINPESSNPLLRSTFRNLKLEPVGTNMMHEYVVTLHEKEMEKRGIQY